MRHVFTKTVVRYLHGKCLVEVEMADISATSRRVCETDLCIQVRSVKVYLTAILMDNLASLDEMST